MKRILWAHGVFVAVTATLFAPTSEAYELRPGRVRNPAGLQLFQRVTYNPIRDNYLLLYEDGRALVSQLSPSGVASTDTALSANIGVTHVNAAFNPDDGTFLVAYRDGEPAEIYGRYLSSDATPIGNSFYIGAGGGPNIAFSPESRRYVVTWEQLSTGVVRYRVISGDSTSSPPHVTPISTVATGLSDGVAYGSVADKFLVVYIRDAGGSAKANVHGRFISTNGLSLGPEFTIGGGFENQQKPRVAYAASTNRWMVMWENWAECGGGCPNLKGALVSASGSVVKGFNVAATSGWDTPGAVAYNASSQTFIAGWRSAYTDTNIQARAAEFSPEDGRLLKTSVLLTDINAGVESVAARPDEQNPQALFLWRHGFGDDGIHAGIMNLNGSPPPPPPGPDDVPPGKVNDLKATAVEGGNVIAATAIDSSGPAAGSQDMTKTTDGNVATSWSSPERAAMQTEFITWDLGAPKTLSQVSLLSRNAGHLFPVDYEIQVSTNHTTFTTAFSVTGSSVAPGIWVDHALPDPRARYVKLLVTKTKRSGTGKYRAQVAEVEILEASDGAAVALQWTAPGDDGNEGTAAAYDLRWSETLITAQNFAGASSLVAPAPAAAGTKQTVTLAGFPEESLLYFALKARDEKPNVSELSNVASVPTPGVPPAPVRNFIANLGPGATVELSWLPSGDDGNTGNAASYDIRYSRSPITETNFGAATAIIRPATSPKPAIERYTVSNLQTETKYYFAIKAVDEAGNKSLINGGEPVTVETGDAVPPGAVSDLTVRGRAATLLDESAATASGQSSTTTGPAKATDGNLSSYWSSPGRSAPQAEWIVVDLGSPHSIGRITLLSRGAGALFPQDLEIQFSNDNQTFTTVARRADIEPTQGTLHTFVVPQAQARYVRVNATKTRQSVGGLYYAQIAEIEVWEAITSYLLTLSWTEPGDDGASGKAASFDLRHSRSPIATEAQFNAATQFDGEPVPKGGATKASFSFEPPEEGETIHFRLKTLDDTGNSSLSNQVSALVAIVPPSPVDDLLAFNPSSTSVDLSWRSTGDDANTGTPALFDVRYSACPIGEGNFAAASEVEGEPTPGVSGTRHQMTVEGLSPSTTYCFAIKVEDETGAPSILSNLVTATTDAPDTTAPAAVRDLRGSTPFSAVPVTARAIAASSAASSATAFTNATDGNDSSYWGSAGTGTATEQWITLDTGSSHDIGQVRLRSRSAGALFPEELEIQVSPDNVTFTTVHTAVGLPSTQGFWHTMLFTGSPGRYVRVRAIKPRQSAGGLYYAQIAEIEVSEATFIFGPITLHWTAPGDDGENGTAASYDLRYSTNLIDDLASFGSASTVAGEPIPGEAGTLESFEISLPPGTYYFAIRTKDESGNGSELSNIPPIVVP